MRGRSREINIFNLSMMDVITGAMGAFLIVMIVLARYYNSDPGNKENVEAIKAELSSAKARIREIEAGFRQAGFQSTDISTALREATKGVSKAEKDLDKLREQLDQSKQEIERLEENESVLRLRRAFTVTTSWTCEDTDVDLYVWDSQKAKTGNDPAPFDPTADQFQNWSGDLRGVYESRSVESWFVRSSTTEAEFKVFVKFSANSKSRRPCMVSTLISHSTSGRYYVTQLSETVPWTIVSIVQQETSGDFGDFTIREPTNEEIEAERKAVAARIGTN